MKKIEIFDTTLRDGEQAPLFSMNVKEKIEMAIQLEKLGVDSIEAGFASSSSKDFEAIVEISKAIKNTTIASLSRLLNDDIDCAIKSLEFATKKRLNIFIATSDVHLKYKLNMSQDEIITNVREKILYAKKFISDIEFSAEDASRTDKKFLAKVFKTAVEAGAKTINIPDTVGFATPQEMFELVSYIKKEIADETIKISVHCHNDLGLAVAGSLAAVMGGATQIECTVNGIGERAGNAALEEIVMALKIRSDYYDAKMDINTKQIYKTSKLLSTITGIAIPPNKAIVGANAFAHESGIHQHGVLCEPTTYEIISPDDVGMPQNRMVLGKHSGKHAFKDRLQILGFILSDEELEKSFISFKHLCEKKKNVTDKDIEALVSHNAKEMPKAYEYISFVINSGSTITSTANVKLLVKGEKIEKVAVGDGPVDACFKAIDKIVKLDVHLDNYLIQSITEGVDALGEVVVKINHQNTTLIGRGLSTDIIEASIKAYLNAINKVMLFQ